MKLVMIMTILFYASQHPIMMIMILTLMILLMTSYTAFLLKSSWIPMIIILIMLGGMLVLFIYVASLMPNTTFFKNKAFYIIMPLILMPLNPNTNFYQSYCENNFMKLFSQESWYNTLMALNYLLFTLMIVVFIVNNIKAPIRSM
uniref:NADH dehydrogenase subunit 6 n=1 Tax=Quadristernoseta cf. longigynium XFX-2019 TaxID=2695872 RepID=A0A6B9WDX6_9ACAR|nr:NADH dehydrogenase subunit 6 [Quadristernoseta cf. longigynium XFX-2019]